MNLQNFESHLDSVIAERGREYCDEGRVTALDFDGAEWTAEVCGSEDYTVTVKLSDSGEIIDSGCDCPYDWGPVCKHQAAVFYSLRDKPLAKIKKEAAQTKKTLETILGELDKSTLISLLLEYAAKNKSVKDEIFIRFSKKPDISGYARNIVKASINDSMRRGFVEYADVRNAVKGAAQVLAMIEEQENIFTAANLCFIVLEEISGLEANCDDSNGEAGGVIERAFMSLRKIIGDLPDDFSEHERLADMVLQHAEKPIYGGWGDRRLSVLSAVIPLCSAPGVRAKLENRLAEFQEEEIDMAYSYRYSEQAAQNMQYRIILQYDGPDAAAEYIEQNLTNSIFRQRAIEKAIADNALEKALALCLGGEEADAGYRGLVSDWQKLRYAIYEKQNNTAELRKLGAHFVADGKFDYFLKLKALYTSDEWPPVLEDLLKKMETGRTYNGAYVEVLVNEHLQERLLDYCRKNISPITRLYPHLLPEYQDDVDGIFLEHIRKNAEWVSARTGYRDVCDIIRTYNKALGKQKAAAIIEELRGKHLRQPAFLDELSKIKGIK